MSSRGLTLPMNNRFRWIMRWSTIGRIRAARHFWGLLGSIKTEGRNHERNLDIERPGGVPAYSPGAVAGACAIRFLPGKNHLSRDRRKDRKPGPGGADRRAAP